MKNSENYHRQWLLLCDDYCSAIFCEDQFWLKNKGSHFNIFWRSVWKLLCQHYYCLSFNHHGKYVFYQYFLVKKMYWSSIKDLLAQNLTTLIFVKNMSHLFVHYLLLMSLLVGGSWLKWLLSLCFPFLNLMVIDNSFYFRYAQFALQLSTNVLNIIHLSFQLFFDFFKYYFVFL